MTDFRALCAELADAARVVRECVSEPCSTYDLDEALAAVDAALAQPEPQGIDRYELGDVIWRSWLKRGQDSWCSIADDVLAELPGLAQPEPQGPTDEEIGDWHDKCDDLTRLGAADHYWAFDVEESDVIAIVHAALQRWGHHTSDHR
jgi:hypothetical protein